MIDQIYIKDIIAVVYHYDVCDLVRKAATLFNRRTSCLYHMHRYMSTKSVVDITSRIILYPDNDDNVH